MNGLYSALVAKLFIEFITDFTQIDCSRLLIFWKTKLYMAKSSCFAWSKHFQSYIKGQYISIENWQAVTSPKNEIMNLFFYPDNLEILETWNQNSIFKYFQVVRIEKKIVSLFLGRSYSFTILFWDLLTFRTFALLSRGWWFKPWCRSWFLCKLPWIVVCRTVCRLLILVHKW